jgi:Tol biopolymer transport system component
VAPVPWIASTLLDHTPNFSPDGQKIAFASYRSGTPEIWVCDSNGQNLVPLTSFNGPEVGTPQWSPDGRRIVFEGVVKGQSDVFWIGATGGKPQRLTDEAANDETPTWSRDGRWIYFCSDRSGREEIWKMPAEGGEASQITRNGGRMVLESWDGEWLHVLKTEYGSVWRRRIADGKEEQIVDSVQAFNFAVGSKGIYFIPGASTPTENTIELLDSNTGKRRVLAAIHKTVMYGFTVSPDERWILYPQLDQELTADLMLVENFR